MKDRLLYFIFLFIPKNYLSFIVGKLANIKKPKWFVRFLIKHFASFYKININEIKKDISHYEFCTFQFADNIYDINGMPADEAADWIAADLEEILD